ncbi:MAG: hypothetical protein JST93_05710 [Acidobacteria bacterium]|nr:hypothetical protein [Acidobacteriota bacterium]
MNKCVFPLILAALLACTGALLAQEPVQQAPQTDPAKPVVDAVISATQVLEGIEKASRDMGEKSVVQATPDGPRTYVRRPIKNSLILIAAGAVAGAGAGGAITKNSKGAMVGAILGGVAGLLYDRVTAREPGI